MMSKQELLAKRDRIIADLSPLGERASEPGVAEQITNLTRGLNQANSQLRDIEAREQRITTQARKPNATAPGDSSRPGQRRRQPVPLLVGRESREEMRSHALACLDDNADLFDAKTGDQLTALIERDELGTEGVYLRAVSNAAYGSAFAKLLCSPTLAAAQMSDAEREAVEVVSQAVRFRGMSGGFSAGPLTDVSGTLPLPVTVDPTILPTSSGVESPVRQLADVRQITTFEYKAATSGGVTAHFAAEGTEVTDDTPVVSPLTIVPQRAQAFCTFSIESSMDYGTLQAELGLMLQDAKAVLEGQKFISGAGEASDEPEGLLTGAGTAVTLTSAGTAVISVADLESVQEAVAPRWQQNAVWLGNLTTRNTIDQLVAQADASHARIVDDQGNVLRRPYNETSDLASIASSAKPIVYGDLRSAYRIVDRIGMSVELVPHVLGSNRRPLGVRGLYAFWRVSAKVVNPSAIRVLAIR